MSATATPLAYNPDNIGPGWVAFVVVLALVVGTFLLWRSMNTQLRKIKAPPAASFEKRDPRQSGAGRLDVSGAAPVQPEGDEPIAEVPAVDDPPADESAEGRRRPSSG